MEVKAIRLSPVMVSRKEQVLTFVQDYYSAHGVGPTITEICNAASCARSRTHEAIRKLEREQRINRVPGKMRGITPISGHQEAIRRLEAIGYVVNPGRLELVHSMPLIDLDACGRLAVG